MKLNRKTILRIASFLILGLLTALGVFLILRATPEGLGLSDDSIGYIAGARSMLAGQGYREAWLASNGPVTHFPPGFSSVLAFIGLFGLDPTRGARFLNAVLFGLNTGLLGILGWRMTKNLTAGLILAALFVTNSQLLQVHAVAMSEPLFIFLSLLAFWTFDLYFERDHHWFWLILTAFLSGAAYLTRYAGLALVATFIVALFVLHSDWRRRFVSAGIFIAGFLPWALMWAIRNKIVGGNVTNRELIWHPISSDNLKLGLLTASQFLMPVESLRLALFKTGLFQVVTAIILGAVLIWILFKGWKYFFSSLTSSPSPSGRGEGVRKVIAFTSTLYIFGYLASMLATMLLFDASTKFKVRIVAPIYVSLFVLMVALGMWLWSRRRETVILLMVLILGVSMYSQTITMQDLEKGGTGFASFRWYRSKVMEYLRGLPPGIRIYTNQSGAVYFYTKRPTYVLPDLVDPVTALPRQGFEQGVIAMQKDINAGTAVLVLFTDGDTSGAALSKGLYLAFQSSGDEVYSAKP